MAKLIDGKLISAEVLDSVRERVEYLKSRGVEPCLAVIIVGDDPASRVYVNNKKKSCEKVGIKSLEFALPADTKQEELIALIDRLNAILAIPQNVTVGVDHLPGEISYEYHYHVDGAGSNPHTETAGSAGGCYSVAMYHSHSGSSSSGGGCYGSPIYHSHSSSCYSEGSHNSSCSWHREYHSYDCGTVHDWDGDGHGCDGFPVYDCGGHRYLSCGRGSGVIGYSLSCGKNNSTVEGYRVGCGLNDGQITGAHIVYSGVNSVSDLALDQTDEVQAVYEEPAVEETISQENVAEDTEQDTEKNIPENTPESVEEDSVDEMDTAASDTEHEESVDVSTEIVKGTEEEICEE